MRDPFHSEGQGEVGLGFRAINLNSLPESLNHLVVYLENGLT